MKRIFTSVLAVGILAAASAAAVAHAASQPTARLTGNIKIDGSSTVYPITEAVAEEFKKVAPNVNVTVGISGTGGGFKKFSIGETDISDASRPIKKEEADKCAQKGIEYIELPVAFDGLSFVVNTKNTWVDHLTVDELKTIFILQKTGEKDGKPTYPAKPGVMTWKDVRPTWPDKPIKFFAPGTDSGTFDYFKEVLAGKDGAVRPDMSVSEDDNVLVKGVEGDDAAIGFFGFAYFVENKDKLKVVPIDAGKGAGAITPTHETINDGSYAPFSRPLFIYVNKKSAARKEVAAFVNFYLDQTAKLSEEVGYVAIPSEVISRAKANFTALRTGSQFMDAAGKSIHGSLEKTYK
ncbi:MAG: PstS family phosphate ABC transporter substrate-binding protein [Phycisphaerales bacterium]